MIDNKRGCNGSVCPCSQTENWYICTYGQTVYIRDQTTITPSLKNPPIPTTPPRTPAPWTHYRRLHFYSGVVIFATYYSVWNMKVGISRTFISKAMSQPHWHKIFYLSLNIKPCAFIRFSLVQSTDHRLLTCSHSIYWSATYII